MHNPPPGEQRVELALIQAAPLAAAELRTARPTRVIIVE
jgi:hypothetical protein